MARNKANQTNIDNTNPLAFPDGRIKDNDGSGNGTPVNEEVYGDIHEFFAKCMRIAGYSFNNVPDNETFGYQYVNAVKFLAGKNDKVGTLSSVSGTRLGTSAPLSKMETNEMMILRSSVDVALQTEIVQNAFEVIDPGGSPVFTLTLNGQAIKTGDFVRLIKLSSSVELVKLIDGDNLDAVAAALGFLKAASQAQEDAGAVNNVATTPLTNFTAFAARVIGAASAPFLATPSNNGLMSAADKAILDALSNPERNYGTFGPFDTDTGTVGDFYTRSGDVTTAQLVQRTSKGQVIEVTLSNAMDNTTYEPRINLESLGSYEVDNNINIPIWKIVSTTKFRVFFEDFPGGVQQLVAHISVIQR